MNRVSFFGSRFLPGIFYTPRVHVPCIKSLNVWHQTQGHLIRNANTRSLNHKKFTSCQASSKEIHDSLNMIFDRERYDESEMKVSIQTFQQRFNLPSNLFFSTLASWVKTLDETQSVAIRYLLWNFHEFNRYKESEKWLELFHLCSKKYPTDTFFSITASPEALLILSHDQIKQLLLVCTSSGLRHPDCLLGTLRNMLPFFPSTQPLLCLYDLVFLRHTYDHVSSFLLQEVNAFLPHTDVAKLVELLRKIDSDSLRKEILHSLSLGVLLWKETLMPMQFEQLEKTGLIERLILFRVPSLRFTLFKAAAKIQQFNTVSLRIEEKPWGMILKIPLIQLQQSGVECHRLIQLLNRSLFKKIRNILHFQTLVQVLTHLAQDEQLPLNVKNRVIEILCRADTDEFIKQARMILIIQLWNEGAQLHLLIKGNPLSQILDKLSQKIFHIPISIEHFAEKYDQTFGSYRIPDVLNIYSGKLSSMKQPVLMEYLGSLAASVMNNTYLVNRYNLSHNPHLRKIPAHILEKWRENTSFSLNNSLIVINTDNFQDLLLCGTEVAGSCQHILKEPIYIQGLLGFLGNGQTRLIAVKANEHGPILARAILRLLIDQEKKPVLFLEKIYYSTNEPALTIGIHTMAQKTGKYLDCPVTSLDGKGAPYKTLLASFGGPAPVEYIDGAGGMHANGRFIIHDAKILVV